ncbi:dynamin family protein [Flavobacterium subsaxonicum]|uniref:Dynamin N-terminal domain-containing protein n=1 Tax=Flavobacterium subsaxonicum WB 4.1-42 = DSM 21790 TaxID=1121898 RepID=A0A0A2MHS1_9FLAO|nr:dynamin family protein [Flavobacterium subsaxonicum]KGO91018.1 hypothetical protein Q766_20225 [Flavobacterium subsaxonicum WB 4.1-42 = DSM 21790]
MENLTNYFLQLEYFKRLRFEYMNILERIGYRDGSAYDAQTEYDQFSAVQAKLQQNFIKISTNDLPLVIGIVGSFNTGKSSLINSLIGSEFLIMADKSATRKITILTYKDGNTFRIFQHDKDGTILEINYEAYIQTGAHQHKGALAGESDDNVSHFEVQYPCPFIKDFQIVDTPGFSSMSTRDDEITRDYLDQADLLLWTFDAGKGAVNDIELGLLRNIKNKRVIAVINRIDDLAPSQRAQVISKISGDFSFYLVFPYSALNVLTYQQDLTYNAGVKKKALKKMSDFLDAGKDLSMNCGDGFISLKEQDQVIYREPLRDIDEEDEALVYYDSLMEVLKEIRTEVTQIKSDQFADELALWAAQENGFWTEMLYYAREKMDEQTEELEHLDATYEAVKELVSERAEVYYEDLVEEILNPVFNELYTIDYKSGGFLESEQYWLRKKPNTESRRQAVIDIINNAFDSFYNQLVDDYIECLEERGVDVKDNEWLVFSKHLKERFAHSSYYGVIGNFLLTIDYHLGISPAETRNIYHEKLELIMSYTYMHDFTIAFLNYIAGDVIIKLKNQHVTFYEELAQFEAKINELLDE